MLDLEATEVPTNSMKGTGHADSGYRRNGDSRTNNGHGRKSYTITGPEVLTPVQMVSLISERIGHSIEFVALTNAEARAAWEAQGFPEETIAFFEWVHGNTPKAGYTVLPTVKEVTGKAARTFAQWIDEHEPAFMAEIAE